MSDKLKMWAVIELFGHDRLAGYVTEEEVAGEAFVRVDVPGKGPDGFSKLFGQKAIYSITPVAEEVALEMVERFASRPLGVWTPSVRRELPPPTVDADDDVVEVHCIGCGEIWPDSGTYACPACGSEDTEIYD